MLIPLPPVNVSTANPNDYYGFVYNEYEYDFPTETPTLKHNIQYGILDSNVFIGILAIILCLVHLMILLRKSLRTSGVYVFMIAICVSDILNFSLAYPKDAIYYKHSWFPVPIHNNNGDECVKYGWIEVDLVAQAMELAHNVTRRLSIWLAMVMASLRTLAVAFPMNNQIQKLVKPGKAVSMAIILLIVLISYDMLLLKSRMSFYWLPDDTRYVWFF